MRGLSLPPLRPSILVDMEKFHGFSLYRELRSCEECNHFILDLAWWHNNGIDACSKVCSGDARDFFGADGDV